MHDTDRVFFTDVIDTFERRLMMKSTPIKLFILTLVSVFISGLPAFAADRDNGKNQSTPPGWEQGEKTGWEGNTPPGLSEGQLEKKKKAGKKSGKHKVKAKSEAEKARHEARLKKEKAGSEMQTEKEKSMEEIEKAKNE
jgi:hypothetical protein